jgi:hypothetical protein
MMQLQGMPVTVRSGWASAPKLVPEVVLLGRAEIRPFNVPQTYNTNLSRIGLRYSQDQVTIVDLD